MIHASLTTLRNVKKNRKKWPKTEDKELRLNQNPNDTLPLSQPTTTGWR